ncbi:hypothetical protein BC828DRAFT_415575 [Blastocladiella britannica]|nr:hypothetical protein BC828DRAFT_415575 [Blastocladiella britannica]
MINHVAYLVLAHAAGTTLSPEDALAVLNVLPAARAPSVLPAVLSRGLKDFSPASTHQPLIGAGGLVVDALPGAPLAKAQVWMRGGAPSSHGGLPPPMRNAPHAYGTLLLPSSAHIALREQSVQPPPPSSHGGPLIPEHCRPPHSSAAYGIQSEHGAMPPPPPTSAHGPPPTTNGGLPPHHHLPLPMRSALLAYNTQPPPLAAYGVHPMHGVMPLSPSSNRVGPREYSAPTLPTANGRPSPHLHNVQHEHSTQPPPPSTWHDRSPPSSTHDMQPMYRMLSAAPGGPPMSAGRGGQPSPHSGRPLPAMNKAPPAYSAQPTASPYAHGGRLPPPPPPSDAHGEPLPSESSGSLPPLPPGYSMPPGCIVPPAHRRCQQPRTPMRDAASTMSAVTTSGNWLLFFLVQYLHSHSNASRSLC